VQPGAPTADEARTLTLEAFADTIVPGEKRFPGDRAIAGVSTGGGAVACGALTLLADPASGFGSTLETLADALGAHATAYAAEFGLQIEESVPPFVSLSFEHRTTLVQRLLALDHPERELWVGIALFSNMAFDSAAHISTHDAFADGHPGLLAIGYFRPEPDGVWRFPEYSYGRPLSSLHPLTTSTGSPA